MSKQAELFDAILANDAEAVAKMIAETPKLARARGHNNGKHNVFFGRTPLMGAIVGARLECVKALLPVSDLKAIETEAIKKQDALGMAASSNQEQITRWLLEARGGVGLDAAEQNALMEASGANAVECMDLLLAKNRGSKPEEARQVAALAMRAAAQKGALECSEKLVAEIGGLSPEQGDAAFSLAFRWGEFNDLKRLGGQWIWGCAAFFAPFAQRETVFAAVQRVPGVLSEAWARLEGEDLAAAIGKPVQADPAAKSHESSAEEKSQTRSAPRL